VQLLSALTADAVFVRDGPGVGFAVSLINFFSDVPCFVVVLDATVCSISFSSF